MTNRYNVSLGFVMNVDTPTDAVLDVVDTFTENGMRNLVYVVSEGDRLVGYFNGWGERVDPQAIHDAVDAATRNDQADENEAIERLREEQDYGDDELERLAENLNNNNSLPSAINGFPISTDAEVTEMPSGSGWQWLVKDGDTYWGVNEDPGDQVFIDKADYEHDLADAAAKGHISL